MGYSANVQYYPCTGTVWALMGNGDGGQEKSSSQYSKRSSLLWSRSQRHASDVLRRVRARFGVADGSKFPNP